MKSAKTGFLYRCYRMVNQRVVEDGKWILLITGTVMLLEGLALYLDMQLSNASKYWFSSYAMVLQLSGWNILFAIGFILCLLVLFERQVSRNRCTALSLILPGGRGQRFLADSLAAFFLVVMYICLQLLFFSLLCQPIMKGICKESEACYQELLKSGEGVLEFKDPVSIEEERMFVEGEDSSLDVAEQRDITEHSFGTYTGMELKSSISEAILFLIFLPRSLSHAVWLFLVLLTLAVVVSPPRLAIRGGAVLQSLLSLLFLLENGYELYLNIFEGSGGFWMTFVGMTDWDANSVATMALICVMSGALIACIYLLLLYEVGKGFLQRMRKGAGDYE